MSAHWGEADARGHAAAAVISSPRQMTHESDSPLWRRGERHG
jgi:hypothetical protein